MNACLRHKVANIMLGTDDGLDRRHIDIADGSARPREDTLYLQGSLMTRKDSNQHLALQRYDGRNTWVHTCLRLRQK